MQPCTNCSKPVQIEANRSYDELCQECDAEAVADQNRRLKIVVHASGGVIQDILVDPELENRVEIHVLDQDEFDALGDHWLADNPEARTMFPFNGVQPAEMDEDIAQFKQRYQDIKSDILEEIKNDQ